MSTMIYDYNKFMDAYMLELAKEAEKNPTLIWQAAQECAGGDILKAWDSAQNHVDESIFQLHDVALAVRWQKLGLISIEALVSFRHEYHKLDWPKIG